MIRSFGAALLGVLIVLSSVGHGVAKELRLGYVDSDRILDSFTDYRDAKQKLQEEERNSFMIQSKFLNFLSM